MRDPHLHPVSAPPPSVSSEGENSFDLHEYLEMVRRHWRLILLMSLLGFGAGLVHFFNTTETYTARTRILIERRDPTPINSQAAFYQWYNPEFYPTQYEILKSRGLAKQVVELLRLWEDNQFNPSSELTAPAAGEVVTAADDEAFKARLAGRLAGGVTVREVKGTQLVDITYTANKPELAMKVANGYALAFIEYGKEARREFASSASGFLTEEIDRLKTEIEDKEFRLQQYSRDADLVAVDPESNVTLKRLDAVNRDYISARTRRIEAESRYNEALMSPKESVADTLSGGVVSDLRGTLIQKEREYATKLKTFKPDFPTMVELRSDIEETRGELTQVVEEMASQAIETARAEFQTARRSERSLEQELEELKTESFEVSSAAVEFNNLRSEITNRRELLEELLRRQSETDVAGRASSQSTIRQVDEATLPGSTSSPKFRKSTGIGFAFGLALGIGLVLLIEYADRSIKNPDDIERHLSLASLAVIPDLADDGRGYNSARYYGYYGYSSTRKRQKREKKARRKREKKGEVSVDLVPHYRPRLAVSEAYRSLRTALLLSTADELKVVAVTSATAGEGKTATASNLAAVMAQLGKRVLLIDADVRKPRTHEVFKVSNRTGLVNYLVGRCDMPEVIRDNEVPNLMMCPSGPTPPNPSELLASDRMRYLIDESRKRFDFVVIDTPPTLAVTDSTLVGSMVDGVVLCVRAGRIPRDEARACRDRLQLAGVRILGAVLNCHRPLAGKGYRGYSYHYEAYGEYTQQQEQDGAVA